MSSLRIFEKEASITMVIASLMILSILAYAEGQSGPTVPGKPILTATVISSSQINLSWTTPSNGGSPITGYKIEYKIIPAGYSTLVQISGNTTTTYSHTGLQSDKYYVYHILAINSVGTSELSDEAIGHTEQPQNIAPNPPTNLIARAVSPTKINMTWTVPSNNGGPAVTGYKIEEKVGSATYSVLVANTGNTTSYSRSGLTTGTTYTYKVSAINSVGTGTPSNEASATPASTSAPSVPNPPTNLSAAKVSQTQVDLSWNAPSDNGGSAITGYKIEEKVGTGSFGIVTNTGNANTSYSRTGLTAGVTYIYRVSAINSAGTSSPSNEVTSSQTITVVPNPPTNLVVASASPTQLNLSWKAPSDNSGPAVTGYKIEVKSGSNPYAVLVSNTGSVTSYSHSGLTTGTTYTYKVSAINSVGTSASSNEVSAKPTKTIVPTSLTAVATSPTQIRLTWFAPSETFGQSISGYKIEREISKGVFTTTVENTNSQATTYSVSGLTTGTTYTFVVSAIYPLGASAQSNEASATPTPTSTASPASPPPSSTPSTSPPPQQTGTSPNQPTSLTARAVSPTKINLFWAEPTNNGGSLIVGYKIEMKSSGGSWSTLTANTGYATTTYSKDGLITGTQYTFRVSAINSIGTSSPSNEASATPKSSSEPGVPASPTDLTAKPISSTQINMTWKAPIDNGGLAITGYKISQKVGTNMYRTLVDDTKNTKTSYLHSNLTAGAMYTYKVSTINSAGTGNPSNEASATTTAPTPSPTPVPTPAPAPTPTPTPSPIQSSIGRVKVGNTDFALRYEITGGKVLETEVDVETNSLLIKVDATNDGVLTIPLPRTLIDAKTNQNADDVFYVLVNGEEASFTETTTSNSRTLAIDIPDGTTEITIYGTQAVPEFGTLAFFILTISIASIIMITAKTRIISKF